MSKAAIGQALDLLRELPDSDQQAVLQFLKNLKNRVDCHKTASSASNSALQKIDGLLVFTGEIGNPAHDWIKTVHEERDREIADAAAE